MYVLGLMSGSSLDGIDLAVCQLDFEDNRLVAWQIKEAVCLPYDAHWQGRLKTATQLSGRDFMALHADLGRLYAQKINAWLPTINIKPSLIASHGHTVFHEPALGFSTQIGCGATISEQTGITTVCDFRNSDIAAGGQGAPFAPLADKFLFSDYQGFINFGGIANISIKTAENKLVAFDVCACNALLNAVCQNELGIEYDDAGTIAQTGQIQPQLLELLNRPEYLSLPYPKSLSNDWVQANAVQVLLNSAYSAPDKLRTATEHIALQLAKDIRLTLENEKVDHQNQFTLLATGGGAFNQFLIEQLGNKIAPHALFVPDSKTINYKEAALMALMGAFRVLNLPNNLTSATGASREVICGAIYN